ncbi:MAG: hypothetical protein M3Z86_03610 [Lactobacillus panisapium]|nr:hypothetical protein [Lactobacillus panisapium]
MENGKGISKQKIVEYIFLSILRQQDKKSELYSRKELDKFGKNIEKNYGLDSWRETYNYLLEKNYFEEYLKTREKYGPAEVAAISITPAGINYLEKDQVMKAIRNKK